MILPDFKAFPRVGRILGIDWGACRTGVAVSDASREFVFTRPSVLVKSADDIAPQIAKFALAENVVGVVIGLPVHGDGTESETSAMVRQFANQLSEITDLPICFIEENLTSLAAQEQMGRVRVRDIKQKLDSESARVILENAIAVINRL
ncbi:MAG: Holliday junction resolvase RuvX [Muribaculaceae bacterium]|nr:Holliday junction resolvase RuvX [Muribaculaceae bacterium]